MNNFYKKSIYLLRVITNEVEGGFIGFDPLTQNMNGVSLSDAKVYQGDPDKVINKLIKNGFPYHGSACDEIILKPVYIHLSTRWTKDNELELSITGCDMKISPILLRDKKIENLLD